MVITRKPQKSAIIMVNAYSKRGFLARKGLLYMVNFAPMGG